MKIILNLDDVKKILCTISTEEIEKKLAANYEFWNIAFDDYLQQFILEEKRGE